MFGYTYLQRFHDTKFRHFRYHKTSTKATKKKIVALLSPSNQPINNDGDDGGGSGGHPKEWHVAETQISTMLPFQQNNRLLMPNISGRSATEKQKLSLLFLRSVNH